MNKSVSGLDLTTLNSKSAFANGLLLSRRFSWSLLFDRMEELAPPNVRIRSIRPSISTRGIEIQIDGMAHTPEDLYEFEQALVSSDYFSGVYPESENTKEGRGDLNFDITMDYVQAGKTASSTTAARLPATPTEGLPKSAAEGAAAADPNAAVVDPNAPVAGASAPAPGPVAGPPAGEPTAIQPGGPPADTRTAAQPPAAQPSPPAQAPAAAPAGAVPETVEPQPPAARPVAPPPGKPPKPPREMTNAEFVKWGGQDRFVMIRGKLRPIAQGKDSALTNEEFIEKNGLEEFLKARGGLLVTQQRSAAAAGGARP
jgi:hypothetical protein